MKFLKYFAFGLRLRYRNPSQIFFVFIFPLFLMFAFSSSFGKSVPHYIENNIASILLYSVLSASLTSLSVQIAEYQSGKIYQLFIQRGIKKIFYIAAQIASFMIIIFCSTIAILLVAHFSYHYDFPKLSILLVFYLKLYLYSLPFCLLAIIIGLLAKNTATASAIAMPIMFLSFFFSGMMIPLSQLSGGIRKIADHFFLTQLLSDLNHTLTSTYTVILNWSVILLSFGVLCLLSIIVYKKKA
ncbi:ABC transporter permease [Lactococcus cremoris]|uniref:ABC transporter permease n=2 Tax=Lactococcus lactis subsp. cremoris TaxID=1359 RepID=A0A161UNN5_LACLC|nr:MULTISPECIES: ABC transporter permease [Lactococcus]EQC55725.1 ABC transporter permease [Lactococcus cremoris subsp. cremoris TIFN5]EQC85299.1 ABC transporter permease [Lactococcus cremoris subsp. cremoris TIFN1]AFW91161.1 ABC transporter permease protein [Lactococcus cremoris subsp. cremoris UC509.9]ARD90824.1 ABC transporter permease [Lactococcus cremoris]ARE25352.1 ABC transporter permease [Lactococcus cremoris]